MKDTNAMPLKIVIIIIQNNEMTNLTQAENYEFLINHN